MGGAIGQPFAQTRPGGSVELDQAPAIPFAMPDDQLPGALRQANIVHLERGELADPHTRQHQKLNDRAIAAGRQAIGLALQRTHLLPRQCSRLLGVDLDAADRWRAQGARVQQRRGGGQSKVHCWRREPAVDQATAPIGQHGAAIVMARRGEQRVEFVLGV